MLDAKDQGFSINLRVAETLAHAPERGNGFDPSQADAIGEEVGGLDRFDLMACKDFGRKVPQARRVFLRQTCGEDITVAGSILRPRHLPWSNQTETPA